MHNQNLYLVEQYNKNELTNTWLELHTNDFNPPKNLDKE